MGRMSRRHGFDRPFSCFQVLSWIIAVFIFISFSVTLCALLLQEGSEDSHYYSSFVCAVLYYMSFLAMVLTTIVVTASNPTDPTVALERLSKLAKNNKMAEYKFNERDYSFHCDICDTHVLKNTKHCQRCNRCSYEFDHHCVWVSNDIGLHNYAAFIRMLMAAFSTLVIQISYSAYTINFLAGIVDEIEVGFMTRYNLHILNVVTLVTSGILQLLIVYLLTYHVWLMCNNTTTYKHIRRQQKREASRVICELSKEQNNDDESNHFSQIIDGAITEKKQQQRQKGRIRCKDIFCFTEKSNPLYIKRNQKA